MTSGYTTLARVLSDLRCCEGRARREGREEGIGEGEGGPREVSGGGECAKERRDASSRRATFKSIDEDARDRHERKTAAAPAAAWESRGDRHVSLSFGVQGFGLWSVGVGLWCVDKEMKASFHAGRGVAAGAHLDGAGLGVVLGRLGVHVRSSTDDEGGGGADAESHLVLYVVCATREWVVSPMCHLLPRKNPPTQRRLGKRRNTEAMTSPQSVLVNNASPTVVLSPSMRDLEL